MLRISKVTSQKCGGWRDACGVHMQGFGLLLGADVAYSLKALPSLFRTASLLLSKQPGAVFLLGYVSRCPLQSTSCPANQSILVLLI